MKKQEKKETQKEVYSKSQVETGFQKPSQNQEDCLSSCIETRKESGIFNNSELNREVAVPKGKQIDGLIPCPSLQDGRNGINSLYSVLNWSFKYKNIRICSVV